jgi:CheY-like chemotaxis protein
MRDRIAPRDREGGTGISLFQINLPAMRVLVVDDSSSARRFLSEMLHEIGVGHVTGAADGAEAIETLRDDPADIMFCELHMAPVDGIQLTRLLRNAGDSPNCYLPVVILTADATHTQMKNALLAGANAFMSKPVKMSAVHKKLISIFSHPLVFVRDSRNLRPVLALPALEALAPRDAAAFMPPGIARGHRRNLADTADGESDGVDKQPLTRRDLGLR